MSKIVNITKKRAGNRLYLLNSVVMANNTQPSIVVETVDFVEYIKTDFYTFMGVEANEYTNEYFADSITNSTDISIWPAAIMRIEKLKDQMERVETLVKFHPDFDLGE